MPKRMMSCIASKPVFVAVLFFLCTRPSLSMGQTYTQEERFETCCKNATSIGDASYCNYRDLKSLNSDQFGSDDAKLETEVKIAHDNQSQKSVNEAWAAFLPCLNNGKDNRDCCLKVMSAVRGKACSPLCNGQLRAKDMDIEFLNSMECYSSWYDAIYCALVSG